VRTSATVDTLQSGFGKILCYGNQFRVQAADLSDRHIRRTIRLHLHRKKPPQRAHAPKHRYAIGAQPLFDFVRAPRYLRPVNGRTDARIGDQRHNTAMLQQLLDGINTQGVRLDARIHKPEPIVSPEGSGRPGRGQSGLRSRLWYFQ